MILREGHARFIGYGAMLLESFVGVMAMIAACAMPPGVYFAINSPATIVGGTAEAAATTISGWGYPLTAQTMTDLAHKVGEITLLNRAGGAPSLAVGMAQIFSSTIGGDRLLSIWYHFAIMFEALFILTVLDAGTRVGRFMIQELGGRVWKPFARTGWMPGILLSSALIVANVGIFSVSGRGRSTGRDQFAVAAVWDLESTARRRGAGGGDDDFAEDGPHAMDLGDDGANGLARDHHDDCELPENIRCESANRISCRTRMCLRPRLRLAKFPRGNLRTRSG